MEIRATKQHINMLQAHMRIPQGLVNWLGLNRLQGNEGARFRVLKAT